jgi:predicted amidohydrolase YtcJ
MDADRIFKARVVIPGPGAPDAEFVAVKGGRVVVVGGEGAEDVTRAGVPVTDFGDAVILPGLWDAHVHLLMTGIALREVDLSGARRLADVLELVREAAGGPDEVVTCRGLDDSRLAEGRLPTGAELDVASPAKPVVAVRVDHHSVVVNGATWQRFGLDPSWPGVELDADGRPTGVLRGRANELALTRIGGRLEPAAKAAVYRDAATLAASRGVVALCALEGSQLAGEENVRVLLDCRGRLPLETFVFPQVTSARTARELGLPRLGGCLMVDGSFGSWTAALKEPYADKPGTRGELYFAADDLNAVVMTAHAAGLQVALHAIGDRAVAQALDAYGVAAYEHPRDDCRHRVEHAELVSDHDLARAAELGVIFSVQPAFEWFWGGPGKLYETRLGERRHRTNRLRSTLAAGIALAGGSDSNITPINPLLGIAAAMHHPTEEERLSFDDALAMFTLGAAASVFAEDDWGTLSPGKWASFTVLGRDPRRLDAAALADAEVLATVVKGEFTYKRDGGKR